MTITTIYVLPTEEGMPPRAILGQAETEDDVPDPTEGDTMIGEVAVFTSDMGCWTLHGSPLPKELSDAISEHAKNLGVPGF